jgi:phage shock protein A
MNSLKKIFISIKSQVDQVANDFENHEALAESAIQDLQTLNSKTRLHLHRVSNMSAHYQKQLEQQQKQAQLWSERALKAKNEDEQKALQCVKRLRQTQQQITLLEQQYEESCKQKSKIRDDLNRISEQLQVLKNKKEILAARQNRANIQESLNAKDYNPILEVNNIFERWEGSVVSSEFEAPDLESDPLAREFEQEEDELALKMMLDELDKQNKRSKNNDKK